MNKMLPMKLCLSLFGLLVACSPFTAVAQEKPVVYVTFWFDTEDFILPQADDAAKRIADMFTSRDLQATFKIVGEKARVLEERGRNDVILALAKNDISYHSTWHSVHPTPSEYTRDLDWHEGVLEFKRREGPGLKILQRVFGVNASCYGQPGGSWTPQSYAALRDFQIPVYLDVTPHVNLDNRPFWYGGLLTVLELGDCVMRTGWPEDEVKQACQTFDEVSLRLQNEGGGLISIFYHPCEFVHEKFWDGVNFSKGANPPRSQWKQPPLKSAEKQEQAFNAFETFLTHISNHSDIRIVTARELASIYADRAYSEALSQENIQTIAKSFQKKLSFVDLGSRTVSAGEGLLALARTTTDPGDRDSTHRIETQFAYGPASRAETFITTGEFPFEAIEEAAQALLDTVATTEQLPSVIWVAGKPMRPEDFAVTLASLVAMHQEAGSVTVVQGELEAQKYVADDNAPWLWSWVVFPEGFKAPKMMEIAKLQAWTIKPAVLRHK